MSREKSLKGWLFAKQGEEAKPLSPLAGVTYRNEQLSKELVEKGWPFKEVVNSEDFNQFLYLLTSVVKHLESQGVLHWSEEVNYERGALVLSDDYYVYQAIKESGPDSEGYKDPQTNPEYWELFTQGGILDPNAGQKFGKLSWYQYDQPNQVNPLDNEKIEYVTRSNISCYGWRENFSEDPEEYNTGLDCGWKDYIFGNATQSWVYRSFYDKESSQYQIGKNYHDKARMYETSGFGEYDEEGNIKEVTRCILTPQGYRYYKGEVGHIDVAGDPDYKNVLVPEYTLMDSGKKWKKMRQLRVMKGAALSHQFYSAVIALDTEGYLWAWGDNFNFVNNGVQRDDIEMKKISEQRFIDFEVSLYVQEFQVLKDCYSCYALSADGKLYAWGRYTPDDSEKLLSQISTDEDPTVFFRSIYPWYSGVLALDSKGRLWGCGKNIYGELCNGSQEDQKTFTILNHSEWADIAQIGNPLILLDRESHSWYCGISGLLPDTTVPLPLSSDTVTDFCMVDPFPTYTYDEESQKDTSSILVAAPSDNKFLGLDDFATLKQALEGKSTNKMISPHLLAQVLNSRLSQNAVLEILKQGVVFEERNKFLRQDGYDFVMASDVFYSILNDPETDENIYVTVEEKIREIQSILDAGGGAGGGIVTINGLAADAESSDIVLTSQYVLAGSEFIQELINLPSGWQHGFTDKQPLSGIMSVSIRRFDSLYNSLNKRVADLEEIGVVTSQVQSVNGVSPDPEGNIALKAENITFDSKDDIGNDIPTSQHLTNGNLQSFFKTTQYAIFSVNGKIATTNDENLIDGAVTLTGSDIYVAAEGTTGVDWQGATLDTITVEQMAKDVYSCINSINKVPSFEDGTIVLTGSEIPINSDSWDFENGCPTGLSVGDVLSYFVRADGGGYQYVSIDASYVFTSSGTAVEDMINASDDRKIGVPSSRTRLSLGQGSLPSLEIPTPDGMTTRTIYTPGWLYIFLDITTEQEVNLSFDLANYSGSIRRTTPGTDTFMYPCKSGESYNILINYETTIPEGVTCVIEFLHGEMINV